MNANELFVAPSVFTTTVLTMPKSNKSQGKGGEKEPKGETIAFRPLKSEELKIDAAVKLTGLSDSELALICMQKHLDEVVAEVMAEQDRMRRKYAEQFSIAPEPPQPKGTSKPVPVPKGR